MAKPGFRIKSKGDSCSVYVNFRPSGQKVFETRTGLTVLAKEWSQIKQCLKGRDPQSLNLNQTLSELRHHIINCHNESQINGSPITLLWFKKTVDSFFNRGDNHNLQIVDEFLGLFISKKLEENSANMGLAKSTITSYNNFRKILRCYQQDQGIALKFDDLDKDFFDDFLTWSLSYKGYKLNYTLRNVNRLKTICKEASSRGLKVNPHYAIYTARSKKEERYLHILNEEEIEQVKLFTTNDKNLENTRKWLLIGVFIGQRVSDLLNIERKDIRKEGGNVLIDVVQQKTGKHITAGVKDDVVMEILTENFPDKVSSQSFNRDIKRLCMAVGIDCETEGYKVIGKRKVKTKGKKYEFISSHDLRRSFATNSYYKGIPISFIMGITGHTKESTFFEYIGQNSSRDHQALAYLDYL